MFKRLLIFTILLSMLLHSLSRLGVLSIIYENRFAIAVYIGFIDEEPIAFCSTDYYADQNLVILEDEKKHEALPVAFFAKEIILFQPQIVAFNFESKCSMCKSFPFHNPDNLSLGYPLSVFQPPAAPLA
jgi:hypothetical protein